MKGKPLSNFKQESGLLHLRFRNIALAQKNGLEELQPRSRN